MRVLLALVHYFKGEADSRHSSTDERRREQRAAVLRRAIDSWRGTLGPTTSLTIETKRFDRLRGALDGLDIMVITNGTDHLLDPDYAKARGVRHVTAQVDNPRMLGFAAHRLFAELRGTYDLFCYSEDDLRIADAGFVDRLRAFQDVFGWKRLLMPNRYEWNPGGPTLKTWIDGDLRPGAIERWRNGLPDEPFLELPMPGRAPVAFRRATNPHSGFFAPSATQLAHWVRQPSFLDGDCSFISPLESAATLAVMKVFPIYKAHGVDAGFFEIEHLDNRFSSMKLPGAGGTP